MVKLKVLSIAIFAVMLNGCAVNTGSTINANVKETFLEQSQNYPRLIELYKERLKSKDSAETRIKLAQIYVNTQDNESALFTLIPVINQSNASYEAFYLQGVAQYNLGQTSLALNSLKIAINKAPNDAKSMNMLGVVQAELGMLDEARRSFNQSRELMYDDVTIKNNLALLDMMEGNYQAAATRLMPIYLNSAGKPDENVKANLAIIVSKLGSFETLRSLYGKQYSDAELFDIFQNLRASEPTQKVLSESKPIEIKKAKLVAPIVQEAPPSAPAVVPELTKQSIIDNESAYSKATPVVVTMPTISQPVVKQTEDAPQTIALEPLPDLTAKELPVAGQSVRLSDFPINTKTHKPVSLAPQVSKQEFSDLTGVKRNYGVFEQPVVLEKAESSSNNYSLSNESTKVVPDSVEVEEQKFADIIGVDRKRPPQTKSTAAKPASKRFVPLSDYSLATDQSLNIPVAQFKHHGSLIDITLDQDATIFSVEQSEVLE